MHQIVNSAYYCGQILGNNDIRVWRIYLYIPIRNELNSGQVQTLQFKIISSKLSSSTTVTHYRLLR